METKHALVTLAEALAAHQGVSHFAISMRATGSMREKGKGDFFLRLMLPNADCRNRTFDRMINWFDLNWPGDLEWPRHIPRPRKKKEAA